MTQVPQDNTLYFKADASAICFRRCRVYIRQCREYARQRRIYSRQRRKQITLALNRRNTMAKGFFVHGKRHKE